MPASYQRGFVSRPYRVDALVLLGIVNEQRRLDVGNGGGFRRGVVRWRAGGKLGPRGGGEEVDAAAAPAEAGGAELTRGLRVRPDAGDGPGLPPPARASASPRGCGHVFG